jgi:hypothetical protein
LAKAGAFFDFLDGLGGGFGGSGGAFFGGATAEASDGRRIEGAGGAESLLTDLDKAVFHAGQVVLCLAKTIRDLWSDSVRLFRSGFCDRGFPFATGF